MMTIIQPMIEDNTLAPQFDLPATIGHRVQLWSYKGRSNLALFFVSDIKSDESISLLNEIASNIKDYEDYNAIPIVIAQDNIESLEAVARNMDLQFPLASDVIGSVTSRYTAATPAVFVIDRYGELSAQAPVDTGKGLPGHKQVADWLGLIELQCPECSVPTWRP
jgi:peroxiredoxin